jgi:hypothetical protein
MRHLESRPGHRLPHLRVPMTAADELAAAARDYQAQQTVPTPTPVREEPDDDAEPTTP